MIDEMIIKLALLCFSGKDHEDIVKLEVCEIADLIKMPGGKLWIFLLGIAAHMRTRRGPDVARGPDVVHPCCTRSQFRLHTIPYKTNTRYFTVRLAGPKLWKAINTDTRGKCSLNSI